MRPPVRYPAGRGQVGDITTWSTVPFWRWIGCYKPWAATSCTATIRTQTYKAMSAPPAGDVGACVPPSGLIGSAVLYRILWYSPLRGTIWSDRHACRKQNAGKIF